MTPPLTLIEISLAENVNDLVFRRLAEITDVEKTSSSISNLELYIGAHKVVFSITDRYGDSECYCLSLDILIKDESTARQIFVDYQQSLRDAEAARLREVNRKAEINQLRLLMKKYPDAATPERITPESHHVPPTVREWET